ncbi:hypothetical protein, partial [Ferrovibrio sp.]|uniref:hypothetical protein n=1 Tax=Ferrovibrio sp. TaxID=1917215 RepID=UPI00311F0016
VARAGCAGAGDIDQCLLDTCDREMERPEGEPQDVELAFNCVRAVILRLNGNEAPGVQRYMVAALFRRAQFLAQLGRSKEARRDFQDVAYTWRDSEDPQVRRTVAADFLEAGRFEEDQDNLTEAEKYYEEAGRYIDDPDPDTQMQVVRAFCNHAEILIGRGWLDAAAEKIADIRTRWQEDPDYWIRRRVANLLVRYADGMKMDDERREEAFPLFDEAIAYADRLDPSAFFIQAGAMMSRCNCCEKLERFEDAVAHVDAFEDWMTTIARPRRLREGQGEIDMAEGSLQGAFLIKARCLNRLGRHAEALEAFDRCGVTLESLGEDFHKRDRACNDLLHRVKILADLGKRQEARELYDQIFERMLSFGDRSIEEQTFAYLAMMHGYAEHGPDWLDKMLTTPADGSPDPS